MSLSSDSDSNPFSPALSESSKNPDEATTNEPAKEQEEIKKEAPDEVMKDVSKEPKIDEKKDHVFKDDDNDPGFSNSFLEAKISAMKSKDQLETEDREKMQ